jgi:hypothetical protein
MSAIASAAILFTKLKFLILFSLDIALIRGEHRCVIGFDDGDGSPMTYVGEVVELPTILLPRILNSDFEPEFPR